MALPALGLLGSSLNMALSVLESMKTSKVNQSLAVCMGNMLQDLKAYLENEELKLESGAKDNLECILMEIIQMSKNKTEGSWGRSKFRKLRNILVARTTNVKMMGMMQRLNLILVQIQLKKTDIVGSAVGNMANSVARSDEQFLLALRNELRTLSFDELPALQGVDAATVAEHNSLKQAFRQAKQVFCTETELDSQLTAQQSIANNSRILDNATRAAVYMVECEEADIQYESLTLETVLGKGGFGIVYKGNWNGSPVAVKCLHNNSNNQAIGVDALAEFSEEILNWKTLKHPNIVQLLGTSFNSESQVLCLVLELCDKSLFELIHQEKESTVITSEWVLSIAKDVASGIDYLHKRYILHRDIKPRNVLLMNRVNAPPHAKLCDFGMSIIKQETATMALSSNEGVGGTPAYMAPETTGIIEPVQLSTKLDVFSFGMLLYELAERNIPFKGMNPVAITTSILQGRRPEFKNKTGETAHPAWIYMLIEACWAQDRSQRPLIDEVRRMIESETCPQLSSVNTLASQNVQTNDNNNNSYSNTQPNISMSGSSSPKSQLKHTPLLRASLHEDSQNEVKRPNITSVIHEVDTAGTAKTCLSQQEKVVATESKTIIIEKTSDQSQPDEKSPSKSGISITDSEDIKIPSTSEKKKKKNRKWLFILGGCACVTILAAVVGIIASSTSPNSDEDDKKENEQINQTTCVYSDGFEGVSFCQGDDNLPVDLKDVDWKCTEDTCSLGSATTSYPLLKINDGRVIPHPQFENCEEDMKLLVKEQPGISTMNALRILSFRDGQSLCPPPIGSNKILIEGKALGKAGSIDESSWASNSAEESIFTFEPSSTSIPNEYRIKTVLADYFIFASLEENGNVEIKRDTQSLRRTLRKLQVQANRFNLYGSATALRIEASGFFLCLTSENEYRMLSNIDDDAECQFTIQSLNTAVDDKMIPIIAQETPEPSPNPTPEPSLAPTNFPTPKPSPSPTPEPSPSPTPEPSPAPTFDPASCFEFLGSFCRDEDNGFGVDTSTTVCERPDSDCSLEECMEICNNNDDCQGIEFTRRERSSDKNFVCEIHTNIGKQHSRNTGGKESGRDVCYGKKECS